MVRSITVATIAVVALEAAAHTPRGDAPVIEEDGWVLESDFAFTNPMSALINPDDGLIYLGIRSGDLYRSDSLGNSELVVQTDDIAAIAYDPTTGAIFLSEDFPGRIKRVDIDPNTGVGSVQTWITGFHSGDDDPAGIAPVPADYTGTLLAPGGMVSTDRGFNGPNMVYAWSPLTPENEALVRDDNGTLTDPFDIAVKGSAIAIADGLEGVKLLNDDATVTTLITNGAEFTGAQGLAFDTRSDDLFVLDTQLDGVYRVDTATGEATPVVTQLGATGTNWGGINISEDGTTQRIIISATEADRVYVFSITPPCSPADLAGPFGQLNFFDVSAFLSAFNAMDPAADLNGDGRFDFFDVSGFLSAFSAGCP